MRIAKVFALVVGLAFVGSMLSACQNSCCPNTCEPKCNTCESKCNTCDPCGAPAPCAPPMAR